jgi:predicted nucleic acid-binding protein
MHVTSWSTRRFVELSPDVEERAHAYNEAGLKPLDALHLSCAVEAGADYFCTCDDRLLKRARVIHSGPPKVVNPLELIREIGA